MGRGILGGGELRASSLSEQSDVATEVVPATAKETPSATSPETTFSFASWNISRAVSGKIAHLERLLQDTGFPSFVALQEIGSVFAEPDSKRAAKPVRDDTVRSFLENLGYVIYHCERRRDTSNGGTALLVKNTIPHRQVSDWKVADDLFAAGQLEYNAVEFFLPGGTQCFRVCSYYISVDATPEAFGRFWRDTPSNQISLGDSNATIPGIGQFSADPRWARRGVVLQRCIEDCGLVCIPLSGPTSFGPKKKDGDDRMFYDFASGFNNDHIIVAQSFFDCLAAAESEATVLCEFDDEDCDVEDPRCAWSSDHFPFCWSVTFRPSMTLGTTATPATKWFPAIRWREIEQRHKEEFNRLFLNSVKHHVRKRHLDMLKIEESLLKAARCLPRKRVPQNPSGTPLASRGIFWLDQARRAQLEAQRDHGPACVSAISYTLRQQKREVLGSRARITTKEEVHSFSQRFFGFKQDAAHKPPVTLPDDILERLREDGYDLPSVKPASSQVTSIDAEVRRHALGVLYQQFHASPPGRSAQQELADATARLPKPGAEGERVWSPVGSTELRAIIGMMNAGKCADSLGVRAEHLKLLDDDSLEAILPFFDRSIRLGIVPAHWRTAVTSPVPKPRRDLAILRSWRPVSVTPVLSRACEGVVKHRISFALEQKDWAGNPIHRAGLSQFGFRRGVSTSLPLSGLAMFVRDGGKQETNVALWDEENPNAAPGPRKRRQHSSLLTSIDGSDAFCRALPARAVTKLTTMGLTHEARWVGAFLTGRTLQVKEGGVKSQRFDLDRGVPQGTQLGPLLWSLVIDDLIAECEKICRSVDEGCIAVPIIFADDINFIVRGFNTTSIVAITNRLLAQVKVWSIENAIPMGKLKSLWICPGAVASPAWVDASCKTDRIVFDENLWCHPSKDDMKLLGVVFDHRFTFETHCRQLLDSSHRTVARIKAMMPFVSADKLKLVYDSLVLSRLRYAVDVWYPYINDEMRDELQALHAEGCRVITGTCATTHGSSVVYEAGYRDFDEIAQDEIVAFADRLRRIPCPSPSKTPGVPARIFGIEWVAALFRDEPQVTARTKRITAKSPAGFYPAPERRSRGEIDYDSSQRLSARDVARNFQGDGDPRSPSDTLRPLPMPQPHSPAELRAFDKHVKFIVNAPGGLVKPDEDPGDWPDELRNGFIAANLARMDYLRSLHQNNPSALYVFTDGTRDEKNQRCAGCFIVARFSPDGTTLQVVHKGYVRAGPKACVYTAEANTIEGGLRYIVENVNTLFAGAASRHLILVTDSQSCLQALRVSWLRKQQVAEQVASRHLFVLASVHEVTTVLAFVFSHLGVEGNDLADVGANEACEELGHEVPSISKGDLGDWHVDTTRHLLKSRHEARDEAAGYTSRRLRCRNVVLGNFRNVPPAFRFRFAGAPRSSDLPSMTRRDERMLFNARVGIFIPAGGFFHSLPETCPFCKAPEVLRRNGHTVSHLLDVCPQVRERLAREDGTTCPSTVTAEDLWSNPRKAVIVLRKLQEWLAPAEIVNDSHTVDDGELQDATDLFPSSGTRMPALLCAPRSRGDRN